MERNNGQTIFLSVIGIATLLVAIIGATFAYFTTTMNGDNATVNATSLKVGGASFEAESVSTDGKILPGWTSGAKKVFVTWDAAEVTNAYTCKLVVTANDFNTNSENTASGILVSATKVNGESSDAALATETLAGAVNSEIVLYTGTTTEAAKVKDTENPTFTYTVRLPETATDQTTANSGKTFSANVSCALDRATVYYNTNNTTGTTTAPTTTY